MTQPFAAPRPAIVPPETQWSWLLSHAVLAPSPHNVQPWRVRVIGHQDAELWIEQARTLPDEDVTGSFIVLTMGLFIETLRLVAAHLGLTVDAEPVHEFSWYAAEHLRRLSEPIVPFARLRLREDTGTQAQYPLDLLARRRTSRLHFDREPVPPETETALARLVERWSHRYVQTTEASTIERILRWNIDAVFEDMNHPPYRDELAEWIRYTQRSSGRRRDGLDARCMNVSPPELWLTFHAPWLLRSPLRQWFAHRYRRQIGPVATLGTLSGAFWDPVDAYQAGRCLIHFWLECTRLGLYIHPYGNLVTNRRAAKLFRNELRLTDTWLVFKIGRSVSPPRSHRRTVEEILIDRTPVA